MRAFVTGANGFVGSHLTKALADSGIKTTAFILKGTGINLIKQLHPNFDFVDIVEGNIMDFDSLKPLLKDIDMIFHLAGVIRGYDQHDYDRVNVVGTRNLLRACMEVNPEVKRVVVVSSLAAAGAGTRETPSCEDDYPNPSMRDYYGISKFKLECVTQACKDELPISIIRPSPVFGPGDLVSLDLFKVVKIGIKATVAGPRRPFSFIDVEDLVNAIILAGTHPNALGQIFHIGSNSTVTWENLMEIISVSVFKRKPGALITFTVPVILLKIMAYAFEGIAKLTKNPAPFFNRSKVENAMFPGSVCGNYKAKNLLGWNPKYNAISMIKRAGDWIKDHEMM
ncbi:MAG: NAD-dependent epimerase/dehydratase family protein [Promethearchaeota archaeon]